MLSLSKHLALSRRDGLRAQQPREPVPVPRHGHGSAKWLTCCPTISDRLSPQTTEWCRGASSGYACPWRCRSNGRNNADATWAGSGYARGYTRGVRPGFLRLETAEGSAALLPACRRRRWSYRPAPAKSRTRSRAPCGRRLEPLDRPHALRRC